MNDCDGNRHILNPEIERLKKLRDEERFKIIKLRLILDELCRLKIASTKDLSDCANLNRSLKKLNVNKYMLSNKNENILELNEYRLVNLRDIERDVVRQQLLSSLRRSLKPILQIGQKLRTEIPMVCATSGSESGQISTSGNSKILALEDKRRACLEKLAELKVRKTALLKAAADMKVGPSLASELEMMYAQARANQTKANLLKGYFINELISRSERGLEALMIMQDYLKESDEK